MNDILFVEIYVGMGKIVSWWHEYALGFNLKGIRNQTGKYGLEQTYWVQNGKANLFITCAMDPAAHDVVSFIDKHGNSIKSFAVEVEDIETYYKHLVQENAIILSNGIEWDIYKEEKCGYVRCKLFDDNELLVIQRINCSNPMPGFILSDTPTSISSILRIDHLASVVRTNESDFWINYLSKLIYLDPIQTIGDEFFANMSTGMKMNVLSSKNSKLNKVIVEPLKEKTNKSQVDIFLENHFGNGIQHIAFEVSNLLSVVKDLKSKGVIFTKIPDKYFENLILDYPDLPIEKLKDSNILCEKDGDKILLQVFTEPIGDRPTLFYEFIQRINDFDGFGSNNVKQLFKSLENQLNGGV